MERRKLFQFDSRKQISSAHLLPLEFLLFRREGDQVFSGQPHFLGLGAVWRRLWGVRVLLAFLLCQTFLLPLSLPFPPVLTLLLLPAGLKTHQRVSSIHMQDFCFLQTHFLSFDTLHSKITQNTDSAMVSSCLEVSI